MCIRDSRERLRAEAAKRRESRGATEVADTPVKQAKLDTLVVPSDVLGDTVVATTVDGETVRLHTAAAVERDILIAARASAMNIDAGNDATEGAAAATATVSGEAALSPPPTPEIPPSTSATQVTSAASTSATGHAGSVSLLDEEALLRRSDGEDSSTESVTQEMAWRITLEEIDRLIAGLNELDLSDPDQVDVLVDRRYLIREAAREIRDVPRTLPEPLYRSARAVSYTHLTLPTIYSV